MKLLELREWVSL